MKCFLRVESVFEVYLVGEQSAEVGVIDLRHLKYRLDYLVAVLVNVFGCILCPVGRVGEIVGGVMCREVTGSFRSDLVGIFSENELAGFILFVSRESGVEVEPVIRKCFGFEAFFKEVDNAFDNFNIDVNFCKAYYRRGVLLVLNDINYH